MNNLKGVRRSMFSAVDLLLVLLTGAEQNFLAQRPQEGALFPMGLPLPG